MGPITRAFDARLEVSDGERSVVAKVNTGCVDRYGTVICPDGMDLSAYRKNPVVLCNHGDGNGGLPVGRCEWIKYLKPERAIVAKTKFFEDEYSDGLFSMAKAGVMNAYSVRILPRMKSCSAPIPKELKDRPELADCWLMIRESELAEYSIVSVPGNPEALALAVSRGLIIPDRLSREIGTAPDQPPVLPEVVHDFPPLSGRSFEEVHASLVRRIRQELGAAGDARSAVKDAIELAQGRI